MPFRLQTFEITRLKKKYRAVAGENNVVLAVIKRKNFALDSMKSNYRPCVKVGINEWLYALVLAAFRSLKTEYDLSLKNENNFKLSDGQRASAKQFIFEFEHKKHDRVIERIITMQDFELTAFKDRIHVS